MSTARLVAVAGLLLASAGCGGTTSGAESDDRTLTVLAAASLTETFTELADVYERDHAAVDVRLAFDSSATLAGQVIEGAPADVLATADAPTMAQVTDAGSAAAEPSLFASNTLVLVVPAGNPAGVERLEDLERDGTSFVACAETAPCGALAQTVLRDNAVDALPVSYEVDVKAVLSKVTLDEADAGLVYATDAVAAGDQVETIEIPHSPEAVNSYLIAPLEESENSDLAQEWVDLVLSDEGQRILEDAGFGPP